MELRHTNNRYSGGLAAFFVLSPQPFQRVLADRVGGFVPEGGQLVGVGRTVLFAAEGEALLHQANLRSPMREFKRRLDTRLEV